MPSIAKLHSRLFGCIASTVPTLNNRYNGTMKSKTCEYAICNAYYGGPVALLPCGSGSMKPPIQTFWYDAAYHCITLLLFSPALTQFVIGARVPTASGTTHCHCGETTVHQLLTSDALVKTRKCLIYKVCNAALTFQTRA